MYMYFQAQGSVELAPEPLSFGVYVHTSLEL